MHLRHLSTGNRVFPSYLDRFAIVIIDDILVYSKGWEQHARLFRSVLEVLRGEQCLLSSASVISGCQKWNLWAMFFFS